MCRFRVGILFKNVETATQIRHVRRWHHDSFQINTKYIVEYKFYMIYIHVERETDFRAHFTRGQVSVRNHLFVFPCALQPNVYMYIRDACVNFRGERKYIILNFTKEKTHKFSLPHIIVKLYKIDDAKITIWTGPLIIANNSKYPLDFFFNLTVLK